MIMFTENDNANQEELRLALPIFSQMHALKLYIPKKKHHHHVTEVLNMEPERLNRFHNDATDSKSSTVIRTTFFL
jgi:hypothetical protein